MSAKPWLPGLKIGSSMAHLGAAQKIELYMYAPKSNQTITSATEELPIATRCIAANATSASAASASLMSIFTSGIVASSARPQVFLEYSRRMKPASPHVVAQLLRTIQYGVGAVALKPTACTQ